MTNFFDNKKPDYMKLLDFGFKKKESVYSYKTEIYKGQFELLVEIEGNDVTTKLFDLASEDLYTLHLLESAEGTFIGKVREEYETVLKDISEKCFETDVFTFAQSKLILKYAQEKYGTKPEYLWAKFPRNAVCRRKDNKKWYFALLSVMGSKLGIDTNEIVEVIDIRVKKEEVDKLLNNKNNLPLYPAYHMNKKSWITIVLDGSMGIGDIYKFIDKSFELAKK